MPYASRDRATDGSGREVPVMHARGHDMHATCLVGAATVLARYRRRVVWHRAGGVSARRGVRARRAGHGRRRTVRPVPEARHRAGPACRAAPGRNDRPPQRPIESAMDAANVVLHGRGGHGARPDATVDPVLMAANVVTRLQGIVPREVAPSETAVVTVGRLQAGSKTPRWSGPSAPRCWSATWTPPLGRWPPSPTRSARSGCCLYRSWPLARMSARWALPQGCLLVLGRARHR